MLLYAAHSVVQFSIYMLVSRGQWKTCYWLCRQIKWFSAIIFYVSNKTVKTPTWTESLCVWEMASSILNYWFYVWNMCVPDSVEWFRFEFNPFKTQWLLYVPQALTFKSPAFCPQNIFMYFIWFSEWTVIVSLNRFNRLFFVMEMQCVFSYDFLKVYLCEFNASDD
jgi:hypothetical protein